MKEYYSNAKREEVKDSFSLFKKRMPLHPDVYKANYASSKL